MTDETSAVSVDANSNVAAAPNTDTQTQTSATPAQETAPVIEAPKEKLIPQSKVNEIVGREKIAERERVRAEMQARMMGEQKPQVDIAEIERIATEAAEKRLQANYAAQANHQAAKRLYDKIDAAKAKYPDFEKVTKLLNIDGMPVDYAHVFNEFDNAGDILYELGKNPEKLASVTSLSYDKNLTKAVLGKISDSIKTNETALKEIKAKPPLSQTQASITGVDSGAITIDDFRALKSHRF